MSHLNPLNINALRDQFRSGSPFPFFAIDDFLEREFAESVVAAYPDYDSARAMGFEFDAVNEKFKIQITDSEKFPDPVKQLAEEVSSAPFMTALESVTGIPKLLADSEFSGGGMHLTGGSGRLDVHVDFNYLRERQLHRRLNILIYLNPRWETNWGGNIELWDETVSTCVQSFEPKFNRCVVFETSERSFHGVTAIRCPRGYARKSFAAYYYTREAPAGWDGATHSTVFRSRPDEKLRGRVLMPLETLQRRLASQLASTKEAVKKLIGRS